MAGDRPIGNFDNDIHGQDDLQYNSPGLFVRLGYDSLDRVSFPSRGSRLQLSIIRRNEDLSGGGEASTNQNLDDDYNSTQAADLVSTFASIDAETHTVLGESIFQAYTYFMSRNPADLPVGQDGTTQFPLYQHETSKTGTGGAYSTTKSPDSPVLFRCQKNFMIIVTDGEPTFDDFQTAVPSNTAGGFSDFAALIGDYNSDGETEFQDDLVCTIPFWLSSQIVHWGRWIFIGLGLLILVAAVGARKARVKQDRREAHARARGGSVSLPSRKGSGTPPPQA